MSGYTPSQQALLPEATAATADAAPQACAACGATVPPLSRFCNHCGARLEVAPAPAPPSAPATERREVTVMFVDVTGFTSASHALDSEEVFVWMDEMMRFLAATIARYDGTIDKYTGDGLMALFGAPNAHENDPERAVRAGLEILDAISPLRERIRYTHGFDFMVRIGINTGAVVAGTVGGSVHAEYTVLGDTVNLAARLEKAAVPGTVLVSATTHARTAPLFRYDPLPPLQVKGIDEPIQTYRPLGLAATPGSLRGLAGMSSPLVGRDGDLARLLGMLASVQHARHARAALLIGEAGMGKSRLVREFQRAAAETGAQFFRGASYAHTQSHALWLVADILRAALDLPAGISPADLRQRLPQALAACGVAEDDTRLYLAHALGAVAEESPDSERLRALDPAVLRAQTHAAVRQVFVTLAQRATTVLILDDLHWIDPASRDLVEHMLRTTPDAPIAFVLVARPEARAETIRQLIEATEHAARIDITVEGLHGDAGARLVAELLHPPGPDVMAMAPQIVQRAAGNPFYIEEIIRVLLDRSALHNEQGVWRTAPWSAAALAEVPDNLKALILARFDTLSAELRSLLKYIAVFGRPISARLLHELVPGGVEELEGQLAELVARQFLAPDAQRAPSDAPRYGFRHVLMRDAIYETILRRDRQVLHRRVADAVSAVDDWLADERTEILAYQYGESDEPARAIPLLVEAGDHAARRSASETSAAHYRRALDLMAAYPASYGDLVFRARIGLGRALKFAGQFTAAAGALREALDRLQVALLSRDVWLTTTVEALGELADVRFREGAYDQAVAQLEIGLATLGADGQRTHTRLWRALLNRFAYVRFRQGALEQASTLARQAVSDADDADDPLTLANLYSTLGGVLAAQGGFAEAIGYVERSIALYQGLSYSWGLANAYTNLGSLQYAQGAWPQALASFERSLALRRDIGSLVEQSLTLTNLAMLRMVLGDHEQAREEFETSLRIGRRLGDEYGMVRAYLGLIHLAVLQGRYEDAAEHIAAAQPSMSAAGDDESVQFLWLQALALGAAGDVQRGLALVQEALAVARASGLAEQEAECLRALGQLQLASGALPEAEASLRASLALCRERDDPYLEALTLTVLGELSTRMARTGLALAPDVHGVDALAAAAAIFERLGASYDARRAQALRVVAESLARDLLAAA